jgi:hypothetical protein
MKKIIILSALLTMGVGAGASDKYDEKYFTITDVKIEPVKDVAINKGEIPLNPVPAPGELPKPPEVTPPSNPSDGTSGTINDVNSVIDTLDKIINLAQKIWEIIEKNQPVVNINVNYANAIPYGIQHWTQLQGWTKPKTANYSFVAKNGYGAEVVKVKYQLEFRYGGNYQGKGKFLTGVTIEPISVDTSWGYKVSLSAEIPDSTIANVGTHEDPIASMQVQLKWTIHTVLKDEQQKVIYYVQGDGEFGEVASPFKSKELSKEVKVNVSTESGVSEKIQSAKF